MALAALVLAAIADLGIAVLLVGVSGFIVGGGPESMHGGAAIVAGWIAMTIACLVAPVVGFILRARGRPGLGVTVAWLPPLIAVGALAVQSPY